MTQATENLLEVTDLVKSYSAEGGGFLGRLLGDTGQRIPALNGVSFSLQEGEVLGLTGESGCGKSVLARIIAGQEKPDRGKVVFMGKTTSAMSESEFKPIQRHLRYLPEDSFANLTTDPKNRVDKLLYGMIERYSPGGSASGKAAVSDLLVKVGLSEEYLTRFPSQMSGGEKQRLAIASALMLRPRLIVADEPVSNLDLDYRTSMLNLMKRLGREYKTAFIFISHNPSMVRYFTGEGRMAVMFAGRFMEITLARSFFDLATHPYTKTLLEVNSAPSPLPGSALDPSLALTERERVDAHSLPLDNLEADLSAEGNISASAQLAAATHEGCPFYRWCPDRFERCPVETPRLLTVTKRRLDGETVPLEPDQVEPLHRAACLWYIDQ